jgi:hypothetical protein
MGGIKQSANKVHCYDELFRIGDVGDASNVKLRVIKEMVQIE